eukprot:51287-Eustigmatos_ZCMA.PRE.3
MLHVRSGFHVPWARSGGVGRGGRGKDGSISPAGGAGERQRGQDSYSGECRQVGLSRRHPGA